MANRINYQIVGRYMDGKEVTAYHLQNMESGKAGRYTREQVCYLVGRGQVTNCSGQIYKDVLILRGIGVSLDSLPVQQENGKLTRTAAIGNVRRGTTAEQAMTQVMLTHSIVDGRRTIGYMVSNAGGGTNKISRDQLLKLAKEGRIGNARYQESNGKPILRGVPGCNLNDLPTIQASDVGLAPARQAQTAVAASVATQSAVAVKTPIKPSRPKYDTAIKEFKNACERTFASVNKTLNNRLVKLGYSGTDGNPYDDNAGRVTLERFDFGITELPQSYGGWIEIQANGSSSGNSPLEITFASSYADDDPETITFSLVDTTLQSAFKNGWAAIGKGLRECIRTGAAQSQVAPKATAKPKAKAATKATFTPADNELIKQFKKACLYTIKGRNKDIEDIFVADGFSDFSGSMADPYDGDGNESLIRFDYHIKGYTKNGTAGGWMEIITDCTKGGARSITFNTMVGNNNPVTFSYACPFNEETFKEGWKDMITALVKEGAIG